MNNDDGRMVVGNGVTTLAPLSQFIPSGQLLSMNPDDGGFHAYARQLVSQGNGLTRGPDGSIYASNDLAASLDKILPNGHVIKGFYQSSGTNGGTVSATERRCMSPRPSPSTPRSSPSTRRPVAGGSTGVHRRVWHWHTSTTSSAIAPGTCMWPHGVRGRCGGSRPTANRPAC